ncbi:hypothetical protein HNQ94_002479 [Salirhabdus euzebyi]|uniref:Uncharacterized protein n=1 Tax=Salirhabdus euzebyi TaxID=394506 RepID=A0A841Q6J9_9BACI|nr:hypothetical protein [Salirhabdus euzebyi]MBB6454028.1 hypothetical protein [Salirhabdus euzebyi]
MASEAYLDFCFVREASGTLAKDVNVMFEELFENHRRLHWYLDEKEEQGVEIVVAEVKGMSKWKSEDDVIDYLEDKAGETFWHALQGYQFQVLPVMKGCCKSGNS